MQCLYCGIPLAILRMLENGTFCCDEHRDLYENERTGPALEKPIPISHPRARHWRDNPGAASPFPIDNPTRVSTAWTFPASLTAPRVCSPCSPPSVSTISLKARTGAIAM